MKDYDKNKESSYLKYWNVYDLYGWAMTQKLSVNGFERIKDISGLMKKVMKNIFLSCCAIPWKITRKVHRVVKFNQKAWQKLYNDMNTKLKKAKIEFEKGFFKLMNNAVFEKTMENMSKHRDVILVTTERRRNYLMSEPNYHITKFFTENLLAIKMRKTEILMNKPVY